MLGKAAPEGRDPQGERAVHHDHRGAARGAAQAGDVLREEGPRASPTFSRSGSVGEDDHLVES